MMAMSPYPARSVWTTRRPFSTNHVTYLFPRPDAM
jgi:hypothetical protein